MSTSDANMSKLNTSDMDHYDWFQYYYGYEYDYDDSHIIPLDELIPAALTYSLTLALGVTGNTLVIFSIAYYGRMRSVTNVFLLSLASADLLLILICVPIKFAAFFSFTWEYGEFLCKFVNYMQNVSMICSVWTLTAMSIERFIAIRYPLRAKFVCTMRRARVAVVCVWLQAFVMAIPIIFGTIHMEVGVVRKGFWCIKEWSKTVYSRLYEMYMLIIMFVIPITLMLIAYIFISFAVWKVASVRASMRTGREIATSATTNQRYKATTFENNDTTSVPLTNSTRKRPKKTFLDDKQTRKQVVVMLILVVILFAICWGPILINNVLIAFDVLPSVHYGWLKHMRMAFYLLAYFNSCINPIVYAFMSRNFRQTFRFAICGCIKGKAFVRAYRFSRSFVSTRTSTIHTKERVIYPHDRENGRSDIVKPMMLAQEQHELKKM